jgi:hypothetical protein
MITKLFSAHSTPAPVYKISETGWLCKMNAAGKWIPLFKLTPEQLAECK